MRKFTIILLHIVMMMLQSACNGLMDVEPENSMTYYNYFKTERDIEMIMLEAYRSYRSNYQYSTPRAVSGEVMDECSEYLPEALRILDATTINAAEPRCSWYSYYSSISQAMMVIENIDKAGLSTDRYNYWLGQALFYKALCYFEIVRDWGDCPYVPTSYKVEPLPRRPWREVLDMAIADMKKATTLLDMWDNLTDSKGNKITTKQIPGKEAAWAMLAHMYAWEGSLLNNKDTLQKAVDAATWVIEEGGIGWAADPEEVCTKVMIGGAPESIFEIEVVYSDFLMMSTPINLEYYYQTWPIRPYTVPGDVTKKQMKIKAERVLEMYPKEDKRREAYFYKPEEMIDSVETRGWALMQRRRQIIEDKTWSNPSSWFQNFSGNIIRTRLADILLLRAECYAKMGKDNLAKPDLDRVRARAGVSGYSVSEGPIYRAIFKEREKELLLERHRWYDMVRTGYWKTDMTKEYSELTDQDIEDGALYLPVHNGAFNSNKLMRQNRYWFKQQ
ncbi:RagB/SusD family nutrient uptake outer membrane protein [Sanguibacteroides sp. AM78-02pH3A]|uniref:RagB/SusD family nutrient uptake outer membrane protein n=1 Tax=Sanguibacteroides sp. AM78-02pH3A TaxID=3002646 RepID=UPI0022E41663|nr:RagB/SusD family nutrient uptake outer membrane protein [Sanguibacteroides sp. AM78-02pH3A]